MQHIRSRKSRADENSHEIYVEIVSCGNDVVKRLRDCMRSDVIVHVTSAAPVDGVTSAQANRTASIRHNISLDTADAQCTTIITHLSLQLTQIFDNNYYLLTSISFFSFVKDLCYLLFTFHFLQGVSIAYCAELSIS